MQFSNLLNFFKKTISLMPIVASGMMLNTVFVSPVSAEHKVSSKGGLVVFDPNCPDYFFKIGGIIRLDETIYFGDTDSKHNEFPNGAQIRKVNMTFEGGLGQNWSYYINCKFSGGFSLDDAFITYTGCGENILFNFGEISSPFSLENNFSSKWLPFLEKSLPSSAFSAPMGLGVSVNQWSNWHSIQLSATQPANEADQDSRSDGKLYQSDRFLYAFRGTFVPYHRGTTVFHVGGSALYQDDTSAYRNGLDKTSSGALADGIRYSTYSEIRSRNAIQLLDTGYIPQNNSKQLGGELGFKTGPLLIFGDYQAAWVDRPNGATQVHFSGYHVQVAYMLTGESRMYEIVTGKFGNVVPNNPCIGAWEIAGRYSYLDLNDNNIQGGRGSNTSFSLGWIVNQFLKVQANYIHARIHPNNNGEFTKLNILGVGAQVVF